MGDGFEFSELFPPSLIYTLELLLWRPIEIGAEIWLDRGSVVCPAFQTAEDVALMQAQIVKEPVQCRIWPVTPDHSLYLVGMPSEANLNGLRHTEPIMNDGSYSIFVKFGKPVPPYIGFFTASRALKCKGYKDLTEYLNTVYSVRQ